MKKYLLAILFSIITIGLIYYMVNFSIDLSYFILYEYVKNPGRFLDFGRSVRSYCYFVLPCILLFTNLILILVRNKKINQVAVILIYLYFIFWCWGKPILSSWPYRGIPAFCIVSGFYLLDVLIVRFIVKKLLQRIAL
jgi:hypothetical protein